MVPESYNNSRTLTPNFISLIISGVGLCLGFLVHAVAVFLPNWLGFSGLTSLWDYSLIDSSGPDWLNATRAMEIFGFLISLLAVVLFIIILVKSSSIQHSGTPVERAVNVLLFLFMSLLFAAGLVIFIGIIILMVWHRLHIACYLSGTAGVLFLAAAGLSGTAIIDLNTNK
ncbi:uncharacterized protein LOC135464096 [Liolophura sinensis]|uniref:uncharacterized protein LOC135464096 n=1 Tax=Liolophura sinensis TaxID=3198878 RepID=UPI0031582082